MRLRALLLSPVFLPLSACGVISTAMSMTDTTMPSGDSSYASLAAAAQARGYTYKHADKNSSDWDNWKLQVYPKKGERIVLTDNYSSGTISFDCDGGRVDDDDVCDRMVEELCADAFGTTCKF